MSCGDRQALDMTNVLRELLVCQSWDTLRPPQTGNFDLPSDERDIKILAFQLKALQSRTDGDKRVLLDLLLYFFSIWPQLSQSIQHYVYNAARKIDTESRENYDSNVQPTANSPQPTPTAQETNAPTPTNANEAENEVGLQAQGTSTNTQPTPTTPNAGRVPVAQSSPLNVTNLQAESPRGFQPFCLCGKPSPLRYVCYKYQIVKDPISPCNFYEPVDSFPVTPSRKCKHCHQPGHNINNCPRRAT